MGTLEWFGFNESGRGLKVFLAVFICKILYFTGKMVGKGSSLPGLIVLRLFPDVLCRLKLPDIIIAVTGSNGKTTTTELIAHAFMANGKNVGWNYEGSNQTEGVATLLLRIATFRGVVKRDCIVMECDERYAARIFKNVKPSVLLVTNLCRDQLSRNGHPEFIADCLSSAIEAAGEGCRLVLNADDPYVASLAGSARGSKQTATDVLWFGVNLSSNAEPRIGMYDDGAFCPGCKGRMMYDYRIAGHYGSYSCTGCGHGRGDPEVVAVMHGDGTLGFDDDIRVDLKYPGVTSAYNFCAAVGAVYAAGVNIADSARVLSGYELTGGRIIKLVVGEREGLLLLSKHENSFAYNASLSWIAERKKPCTVIVLVDAISRKYYTSETSWFWDVDFDLLADECVKNVVLAGRYVNELGARFAISSVDVAKMGYVADLNDLREFVIGNTVGDIYAVTCFSDKAKLLKALC